MTRPPTTIDLARGEARRRWASASPYRVGRIVGELMLTAANPYRPARPAHRYFEDGVRDGRELAAKAGADDA